MGGLEMFFETGNMTSSTRFRDGLSKQHWRLNFVTRRWERLPLKGNYPENAHGPLGKCYNKHMLLYGESRRDDSTTSNDLFVFDLNTLDWHIYPTGWTQPINRVGQGFVRTGTDVYFVGGMKWIRGTKSTKKYCSDVFHLDLRTGTWTALPSTQNPELK
ncbi:unnamed protein product, partial [Darwinula stevensoni]